MGTKKNPSAHDCYSKADPDEPMFVLLGRDRDAPMFVDLWAFVREKKGEDPEKVAEARLCAEDMRLWRQKLDREAKVLLDALNNGD